jgi:hypothetical protein
LGRASDIVRGLVQSAQENCPFINALIVQWIGPKSTMSRKANFSRPRRSNGLTFLPATNQVGLFFLQGFGVQQMDEAPQFSLLHFGHLISHALELNLVGA